MRELVLRLVCGAGRDRLMARRSFLPRPCADLVKNAEAFLRWRSMVLSQGVHPPRTNKVGEGECVVGAGTRVPLRTPWGADCQFRAWAESIQPRLSMPTGEGVSLLPIPLVPRGVHAVGTSGARIRDPGTQNIPNVAGPQAQGLMARHIGPTACWGRDHQASLLDWIKWQRVSEPNGAKHEGAP